jgi:hypothetical protein
VNQYGDLARRHWAHRLPEVYAEIRDPGEFFTVLGELIAADIDQLAAELARDDPPGEGYLDKVQRLTSARDTAQAMVLSPYLDLPADGKEQA